MNKATLSVSRHAASKQYVRYIGQAVGRDGQPKPKCFYLGDDQAAALAVAARLRGDWAALKASGATVWPTAYLEAFQRGRSELGATVGPLMTGQSVADAVAVSETVADARAAYLAELGQRLAAGQISAAFVRATTQHLSVAFDRLPTPLADRPLRSIGARDIQAAILHWASLPMGKVGNQAKRPTTGEGVGYRWRKNSRPRPKRTAKRISPTYAKHLIKAMRLLLNWCHDSERWDKPRRFEKLFKVKFQVEQREAERFTVDELAKLYAACQSDRHRLWILLGLNCGLDRTGLATLDWSMVKGLDSDQPYIERLRHKSGIYSRHTLWDETAKLLRMTKGTARRGLVCLTERGQPLLQSTITSDRDAVRQAWRYILDRSGVRRLSYGKLRKTGAWMIKVIHGLEASEMYLAHSEPGMNKHYAGRDWDKLATALSVMGEQLRASVQ